MKTPAAPVKASKSLMNVFKKGKNEGGRTAPSTPEGDAGGITVMANEYDPSRDVDALTKGDNVPSSPLRDDSRKSIDFESIISPGTASPSEEEKKESDAGDVVSKTLAYFDHVCAVPKKTDKPAIASSPLGKNVDQKRPEWGRTPSLEGDETTTNPSLPSGASFSSVDPQSTSYTNSTSINNVPQKRLIPKSPSQDHENFEVVLDPTSILPEEEEFAPKQRRWPFVPSANGKREQQDGPVFDTLEDELAEKTTPAGIPMKPVIAKKIETKTVIQKEIKKRPEPPKKPLVKQSWKACKKLIAKASGGTAPKQQYHRAEVDSEAHVVRSLEEQEFLQQGSPHSAVEPIVEENEDDVDDSQETSERKESKNKESQTSSVWNSIVATIASTLDPEIPTRGASSAIPSQPKTTCDTHPAVEGKEVDISLQQRNKPQQKVRAVPSVHKDKPKRTPSMSWKALKKGAKNLINGGKPVSGTNTQVQVASKKVVLKNAQPAEQTAMVPKATPNNEISTKPKSMWKAVADPNTGKTYYYHRKTRETTWIKPQEFMHYEIDLQIWQEALAKQNQPLQNSSRSERKIIEPIKDETKEEEKPSKPTSNRAASWPKSFLEKEVEPDATDTNVRRTTTPPARPSINNTIILTTTGSFIDKARKDSQIVEEKKDSTLDENWEKRNEIDRLLKSLPPDDPQPPLDQLMRDYKGKEDVLVEKLRAKVESQPFDEPLDTDEAAGAAPPRSPHRFGQRSTTFVSKASATTRSSALTDRTEKVKNTGKGKLNSFDPISETFSAATSISSRLTDDPYTPGTAGRGVSPTRRIPSRVPVPRERQLMVEELTDSRISAENYEGNGEKRGRIVRGRPRTPIDIRHQEAVYDGDNDTDEDNATSTYENDTYGTDSVSALSENDTDFLNRKDNFEQARRRALDDAIEREDWDLAAALSEGMRAANLPGGYEKAHSSWNQSELDKFIANNDWNAVKSYIARMRETSKQQSQKNNRVDRTSSANKNIGAKSQLQHKELMSESSWTSDSQSSYETYDSESEI